MGVLIDFAASPKRQAAVPGPVPESGAQIIIFPGVRIERQAVDLSARIRKAPQERTGALRPEA